MIRAITLSITLSLFMCKTQAQDSLWLNAHTLLSLQFPGPITSAMLPSEYAYIEDTTQVGLLVLGTRVDSPDVGNLMVRYQTPFGPRVYGAVLGYRQKVEQFVFNIDTDPGAQKLLGSEPAKIGDSSYQTGVDTLLSFQLEKLKGLRRKIHSVGLYQNKVEALVENLAVDDRYMYLRMSLNNLSKYKLRTDTLRISILLKGKRWGANQQNRIQLLPLHCELPPELAPDQKEEIYFVCSIPPMEEKSYLEFSLSAKGRRALNFELPSKLLQNPQRL